MTLAPGSPHELILDVSPGGDLHVSIVDADTRKPLTARLLVHGIDGTVDPSFGPDYRASGAGPLIDALRGDVSTPLPSGRYRIAATKGLEWSVDAKVVEVEPRAHDGPRARAAARRPHAGRGGLRSARACASELRRPGDAGGPRPVAGRGRHRLRRPHRAQRRRRLSGPQSRRSTCAPSCRASPGVEVTTYNKGFGHFGVFPYPASAAHPAVQAHDHERHLPRRARGRSGALLPAQPPAPAQRHRLLREHRLRPEGPAHAHPQPHRLRRDRGLQRLRRRDPGARRAGAARLLDAAQLRVALRRHRQQRLASHPVPLGRLPAHDGDRSTRMPPRATTARAGRTWTRWPSWRPSRRATRRSPAARSSSSSSPAFTRATRSSLPTRRSRVTCASAPRRGSTSRGSTSSSGARSCRPSRSPGVRRSSAPSRERSQEAEARTIRLDRDLEVPVGPDNSWVQIIARGERRMDDVLPFMPVPPFGFTNPVYVVRHPVPPPPWPVSSGPAPVRP